MVEEANECSVVQGSLNMIAYHHFINPTPERAGRVYSLCLQQDIFGQWTLIRVRGRRQREPMLHSQVVESQEAGEKMVAQLVKVRLRHGYVEISKTSPDEGSDDELMPDHKDVVEALSKGGQAVVAGEPEP